MTAQQIHDYSPITGEYTGSREAQPDPRTGRALIPAYSAPYAPPAAGENEAVVYWNAGGNVPQSYRAGTWYTVPDWRGTVYWIDDRHNRFEITELNVEPPAGALFEEPPLSEEEQSELDRISAKQTQTDEIAALAVVVNNNTYQADEISRGRIADRVLNEVVKGSPDSTLIRWRMADNSEPEVPLSDLKDALDLAVGHMALIILDNDGQEVGTM